MTGWTRKERLNAALCHEEADRVAIDFGSTAPTAITLGAYERLKGHLGVEAETVVMSKMSSVAYPDEEILRLFDVDTRGVQPGFYTGGHVRAIDDNTI